MFAKKKIGIKIELNISTTAIYKSIYLYNKTAAFSNNTISVEIEIQMKILQEIS